MPFDFHGPPRGAHENAVPVMLLDSESEEYELVGAISWLAVACAHYRVPFHHAEGVLDEGTGSINSVDQLHWNEKGWDTVHHQREESARPAPADDGSLGSWLDDDVKDANLVLIGPMRDGTDPCAADRDAADAQRALQGLQRDPGRSRRPRGRLRA